MLPDRARSLTATARTAVGRARLLARVGVGTGLVWEVRLGGVLAAVRVLLGGAQNTSHIYRVHGKNRPDKVGLVFRDGSLTFGEIDASMSRIARGLSRRGLTPDRPLLLFLKNGPEFVLAHGGATRVGVPVVSGSFRSTPRELRYLASHSRAGAIVFDADLGGVVLEALHSCEDAPGVDLRFSVGGEAASSTPFSALLDEEDDFRFEEECPDGAAVVMYTSGTTGTPKGAVRRFGRHGIDVFLDFISATPMRSDDVHLAVCPLYHATGMGFLSMTHLLGATVVIQDEFSPENWLAAIERHRVTTTAVVPTMLHRLMALGPEQLDRRRTATLRALFVTGAPLPGPLGTAVMDAFGDVLYNVYGATETGLVTLATPRDLRREPWTIGRALPGVDVRLLDDEGKEVPPGTVGELYARSGALVARYHRDEAATAESFRDGYFTVGDLGRRDAEGLYFLAGRKRDVIISGGVNVHPAEVESVLEAHRDVEEAAVVGIDDPDLGEKIVAFVVARSGAAIDEASLDAFCRERLAGPKRPRKLFFVDALPRNATGKVLKRILRERAG